jgi:hypothetical protein
LARRRGFDWLRQRNHLAAKQFGQAALQGSRREKPDPGFRVKFGGKVNVTVNLGIAASDGVKQRQATEAGPAQLRLMRSQGGDHVLGQVGCGRRAHRRVSEPNKTTKSVSRLYTRRRATGQQPPRLFWRLLRVTGRGKHAARVKLDRDGLEAARALGLGTPIAFAHWT